MDRWIVERNIDRFRELLASDELTDEQRATIERLLAEEQAKMHGADALPARNAPIKAV
jgi:hypothetical protein